MSRVELCRRIVGNIENLDQELAELRRLKSRLENSQRRADEDLSAALDQSLGTGSGPGRRPSRGGRIGTGLDIISAIGQVIANDNSAEVHRLQSEVHRLGAQIREVENRIAGKLYALRDQQAEYNRFDCFDLGFSHAVLDARSAGQILTA